MIAKKLTMKATLALSLVLAGPAIARVNAGDAVNLVLNDINTALKALDQIVSGYRGGDVSAVQHAADKVEQVAQNGATKITNGADLTSSEAVSIPTNFKVLQTTLDSVLGYLETSGSLLANSSSCQSISRQLTSQSRAAKSLYDAIATKSPVEIKTNVIQLGANIITSIDATGNKIKVICSNSLTNSTTTNRGNGTTSGLSPGNGTAPVSNPRGNATLTPNTSTGTTLNSNTAGGNRPGVSPVPVVIPGNRGPGTPIVVSDNSGPGMPVVISSNGSPGTPVVFTGASSYIYAYSASKIGIVAAVLFLTLGLGWWS